MMKKFVLAIAMIVLIVSGCAKRIYTKPGVTQEQWQQDLSDCKYQAAQGVSNMPLNYGADTGVFIGQAYSQIQRENYLLDLCLKSKGYSMEIKYGD